MTIKSKIKNFEKAVEKELRSKNEYYRVNKEELNLYKTYMSEITHKLNNFLETEGFKIRYNPDIHMGIEHFLSNIFKNEWEINDKIVSFIDKLPRFKSNLKFPKQYCGLAFRVACDIELPLNLTRKDFSSCPSYEEYQNYVHEVIYDMD